MKLRSIQVLRGVAACGVVIRHAEGTAWSSVGAAGVDLFFVISGFIMATIAADRRPSEFLTDRVWRIYPLWIIALTPWLFIDHATLTASLYSLTLWPIYGNAIHVPVLGYGWTLSFEMLFYVGFTIALATRIAVPLVIFAACACLSFVFRDIALFKFAGSPMILEFLAGVCIARLPATRFAPLLIAGGFLALVASTTDRSVAITGLGALARVMFWGIPAMAIVCGALSLEPSFKRRAWNFPVLVGDASYSIYLFQALVLWLPLPMPWIFAAMLAVLAGIAVHFAVERPINRARRMKRPVLAASPT